jgi:beta-lactamase class A
MTSALTRRSIMTSSIAVALCCALPTPPRVKAQQAAPDAFARARRALAALEGGHGGRLGVVALDAGSGRRIDYRAAERFAMCSTHKFLTAGAILTMVDQGHVTLDQHVPYNRADLLEYAPVARRNVDAGFMTVEALCAAAVGWSDNTAANLLLGLIGGPAGWTRYARSIGDTVSRLDRTEPTLNTAIPGDPRDTTTPEAMVRDLNAVLLGKVLTDASRARLENWMLDSMIDGNLLRAGLPRDWRVGDKSGSGDHGSRNDIGIILPPRAASILVSVYYTESAEPVSSREQVIAGAGQIIAQTFAA